MWVEEFCNDIVMVNLHYSFILLYYVVGILVGYQRSWTRVESSLCTNHILFINVGRKHKI